MKSITDSIAINPSGWDEVGEGDIQLYDATLVVDTPKFKRGEKVECITFLFTKSICQLWRKSSKPTTDSGYTATEVVDEFPIKLIIG
jgi:hypothetical protein